MDPVKKSIVNSCFPLWESLSQDWTCWRDTFNGGACYRTTYLQRYSNRESAEDYSQRLSMPSIQISSDFVTFCEPAVAPPTGARSKV
jgi:hypothetical protein